MFNFFKRKKKIEGALGYHQLEDWWLSTFSDEERKHIEDVYQPMGTSTNARPLTTGKITYSSQNAAALLSALAGWFNNKKDRHIAERISDKALELAEAHNNILDLHFALLQEIKTYYPNRDKDDHSLERAIHACRRQIEIAPRAAKQFRKEYPNNPLPAHTGYTQLAIILKKQKKFGEVLELCKRAKKQGWNGDWDKRIAEAEKRM